MHFSIHAVTLFQENESCAGSLFKKMDVGIVHLVTSAQSCCHKAALGLFGL